MNFQFLLHLDPRQTSALDRRRDIAGVPHGAWTGRSTLRWSKAVEEYGDTKENEQTTKKSRSLRFKGFWD